MAGGAPGWTRFVVRRSLRPMAAVGAVLRNRSGSALVYTALLAPILLGFVGLSTDVGVWYLAKRTAQSAADAAAMAAALEAVRESGTAAMLAEAQNDAARNGYDPAKGDVLTVNIPPAAGPRAGDSTAVEVVLQRTPPSFFSQIFLSGPVSITARAVAQVVRPESCVWVLEPSGPALELVGTADVELACGVYANSTHPSAISQSGSSCLTATSIVVAGGTSGSCITPEPRTNAPQLGDPLAHLQPPAHGACTGQTTNVKVTGNQSKTLSPGTYCGGIELMGNSEVHFDPGTYVLLGGTFKATGNTTITGSEVTFYLTNGSGGHAQLDLNATRMELSAPTGGPLSGILFFQDRDAPQSLVNQIAGNADLKFEGVLYFPTTELRFAGGSALNGASMMIIARKLRFVGTSYLEADDALSIFPSGLIPVAIVE